MKLKINKILEKTTVEGPGVRFCIWTQGCKRRCKGCFQKQTWDENGGEIYEVDEIFKKIKDTKGIEGVTFLGGEPFEQAAALCELAYKIKKIGLSVLCFTGNYYDDLLKSEDKSVKKLLGNIDLLIDSPFEIENFDISRPWVGSSNQRYIFLTNKYDLKEIMKYKNKIEIRIGKSGEIFINGMGDFSKIRDKIATNVV